MSEFRQNPITGRWVIIAPARASRPWHIDAPGNQAPAAETCPFCAGNEVMTPPEVWAQRDSNTEPNSPGWRVRVVTNKYPALEDTGEWSGKKDGFYPSMNGAGVHEVIIESPDHVVNMSALSREQFTAILHGYGARVRALKQDQRWRYWLIYKNNGERAGATLAHVHSQLVVLPFVPREARDEIAGARGHFQATGGCIYCDIIRRECEQRERLVFESERFVALCPYAARFGYETWILPKHHAPHFEQSAGLDIAALAESLRAVMVKLNGIVASAPFNYVIRSAPAEEPTEAYHWHMEILPQITRAAGFEWGTGVHMNSVAPEDAAQLLRNAPA
jgi:UDPglucose--hexose-1-phosphate uridylyltransferase